MITAVEDASPSPRPQTLPRSARVRKRREFLGIQSSGRRMPTRHFLVLVSTGPWPCARLGVTVTRRIGNSVARNRVKRSVREAFRRLRDELRPGTSIVVVARDGSARLDGSATAKELAAVFAGLSVDSAPLGAASSGGPGRTGTPGAVVPGVGGAPGGAR